MLRQVDLSGLPLPGVKRRAIAELGYGTNAKLIAEFRRRIWRERIRVQRRGLHRSILAKHLGKQPGNAGGGWEPDQFCGRKRGLEIASGTPESQTARWLGEMNRIFPRLIAARSTAGAVRADWPNNPYVRASYASYRVGQWTEYRRG